MIIKRICAVIAAGAISLVLISGCGKSADEASSEPQPALPAESAESQEPAEPDILEEPENEPEIEPETESEAEEEEAPSESQAEAAFDLTDTSDDGTRLDGLTVTYQGQSYLVTADVKGYTLKNIESGRLLSLDLSEAADRSESVERLLEEVAALYHIAHDTPYTYGDSQTDIPCEDQVISCDRLIARALWNIGSMDGYSFRDQQPHGMTIFTEDNYLTTHGFHRIADVSSLQRGDIILYAEEESGELHHTCILTAYNKDSGICARYDAGITDGVPKFSRTEPIVESVLYDYDYEKKIAGVYRLDSAETLADDDQLVAVEKDEADPAELSQRWLTAAITADGIVLKPALYEAPGSFDRRVPDEELLSILVKVY